MKYVWSCTSVTLCILMVLCASCGREVPENVKNIVNRIPAEGVGAIYEASLSEVELEDLYWYLENSDHTSQLERDECSRWNIVSAKEGLAFILNKYDYDVLLTGELRLNRNLSGNRVFVFDFQVDGGRQMEISAAGFWKGTLDDGRFMLWIKYVGKHRIPYVTRVMRIG
jgi:hypothetical protein